MNPETLYALAKYERRLAELRRANLEAEAALSRLRADNERKQVAWILAEDNRIKL